MVFEYYRAYLLGMIIYKTTNLTNGKIYVGQDAFNDPTYLGSGIILERSIKKYGKSNFKKEILEHCHSKEDLNQREIFWIKTLNATDKRIGYNIALGGDGGDTFTNQSPEKKASIVSLRESHRDEWCNDQYREEARQRANELWKNPSHKKHMVDVMSGREIKWADKISKSITEWHKTNPIPEESKRRAAAIVSQKMRGHEFKSFPQEVKDRIIQMYQSIGPVLIARYLRAEGYDASPYRITNVLKKAGVYQRWQKGIGESANKQASISRRGSKNPMSKQRT